MANCTAKSIYRMITTMLVTAGKQATRRCCNARSVFEMPWWSYSDTGIFASANRVGAIVSNQWCHARQWAAALTVSGIGAVIFAAVSLAREAILSLRIIRIHFVDLDPD